MASYSVTVKRSESEVIAENFPSEALKRFSNVAKAKLPKNLQKHEKAVLIIPAKGSTGGHKNACLFLLKYMDGNKNNQGKLPALQARETLTFLRLVQVVGACDDFDLCPSRIGRQVNDDAITAFQELLKNDLLEPDTLRTVLRVLRPNHYVTRKVIGILTTRFREKTATAREQEITGHDYNTDEHIKALFDEEEKQQIAAHHRMIAREKRLAKAAKNDAAAQATAKGTTTDAVKVSAAEEEKPNADAEVITSTSEENETVEKKPLKDDKTIEDKKSILEQKRVVPGAYYFDASPETQPIKKSRRGKARAAKAKALTVQDTKVVGSMDKGTKDEVAKDQNGTKDMTTKDAGTENDGIKDQDIKNQGTEDESPVVDKLKAVVHESTKIMWSEEEIEELDQMILANDEKVTVTTDKGSTVQDHQNLDAGWEEVKANVKTKAKTKAKNKRGGAGQKKKK